MRIFFILFIASFSLTCCEAQVRDSSNMQRKSIEQVLEDNRDPLLSTPGVQGFYQGQLESGEDCIVIMVLNVTPEIKSKFGDTLEGYPIVLEEGGEIRPLDRKE